MEEEAHHYPVGPDVSDKNPLHLIERDLVVRPIVEFRGARRFVCRNLLRLFNRPAIGKISRDPRRPKRVTARGRRESRRLGPAFHHAKDVRSRDREFRDLAASSTKRAEEGSAGFQSDARRLQIRIDVVFSVVVSGHFVVFAAFFVESNPAALSVQVIVIDPHPADGAHAGKRVNHRADERSIAQAHEIRHHAFAAFRFDPAGQGNAVQEAPRIIRGEDRRLAALGDILGAAHRGGWIHGHDLADHQPVEQHAHRRQVLLDGRLRQLGPVDRDRIGVAFAAPAMPLNRQRSPLGEIFDVGGDPERIEILQGQLLGLGPFQELADGLKVGRAGVGIADVGGKELGQAHAGVRRRAAKDGGKDGLQVFGEDFRIQRRSVLLADGDGEGGGSFDFGGHGKSAF